MYPKVRVLIGLICCLLLLAACNKGNALGTPAGDKEKKQQKQLVYGTAEEIKKINPVLTDAQEIDRLLFRGLTKATEDNEIVPDIAKSWNISDDHMTYTFTLRNDAKWEDGEPVTAEDVKYTLDVLRDPATNTPIADEFNEIKSVNIVDGDKVKITLLAPFPSLLGKLQIGIVPKHLLENEDINKSSFNQKPVGNGPYKVKQWDSDYTITLERNNQYYGERPKIDKIVFKPVLDANARILQLKTGEIDLALLEPNQLNAMKGSKNLKVYTIPTADYRGVMYNFNNPLFKDAAVRRALAYAIDRDAIVKGLLKGKGEPAYGPLQKSWAVSNSFEKVDYNSEKAEALLAKAGWKKDKDGILKKDGKPFEFELYSIASDPVRVSLSNIVAEQLKPFGIIVHPKPSSWDAFDLSKIDSLIIGWGSENDPDDHTYRLFHSSQIGNGLYNMGSYRNDKVDDLLEKARTSDDTKQRKALYAEFQDELVNDPPFLFLTYMDAIYAANKKVKGIGNRTLGHHGFGIVWNIEEWDIE